MQACALSRANWTWFSGLFYFDLDLFRLRLRPLWQNKSKYSVFKSRVDLVSIDSRWQCEAAHEFAIAPFHAMIVFALRLILLLTQSAFRPADRVCADSKPDKSLRPWERREPRRIRCFRPIRPKRSPVCRVARSLRTRRGLYISHRPWILTRPAPCRSCPTHRSLRRAPARPYHLR